MGEGTLGSGVKAMERVSGRSRPVDSGEHVWWDVILHYTVCSDRGTLPSKRVYGGISAYQLDFLPCPGRNTDHK